MLHFYRLPIRWRLFVGFGVLLSILFFGVLGIQYRFLIHTQLKDFIEMKLPDQLEGLAARIELRLSPGVFISRQLADHYFIEQWIKEGAPPSKYGDLKEYFVRLEEQIQTSLFFMMVNIDGQVVYYMYKNGELLRQDTGIHADNPDMVWYFNFINSNADYELNLDTNELAGNDLFMFVNYRSGQLADDGRPLSVAGVGMNVEDLNHMLMDPDLIHYGRIMLLNRNGDIEVQGQQGWIETFMGHEQLTDLLTATDQLSVKQLRVSGQALVVGSIWIPTLQRFLVIEIPYQEIVQPIQRHILNLALMGIVLFLLSLALLYPLANTLTRPIARFQRQLHDMATHLDLSQQLTTNDQAELGQLAKQINQLIERINHTVHEVSARAVELMAASQNLTHTAGLGDGKYLVDSTQAKPSSSMAATVEQLSCSVTEITATTEELSSTSVQIADNTRAVAELASATLRHGQEASQAVKQQRAKMQAIQADNEQSQQEITTLGAASTHITQVMQLIHELAAQTKLIAFNAAIEASTAGTSGRRFGVVAAEIRRLADSVASSAEDIETQISMVQETIYRLNMASEKEAKTIAEGMAISEKTNTALDMLVDNAQKTNQAAIQISLSTQQQQTGNQQVFMALRELINASSHSAEAVKTVSGISSEIKDISQRLRKSVDAFKL